MFERIRRRPLLTGLLVVLASLVLVGSVLRLLRAGDEGHLSITEHAGTLNWTPKGGNPDPELGSRYWTMVYPAAYASRVEPGVGVFVEDERIGFVRESEVDRGSVWVYLWIAPEFESIAAGITESEPIEAADGPRVQIYKYSKTAPPGSSLAMPPTATPI